MARAKDISRLAAHLPAPPSGRDRRRCQQEVFA
jgi:hypothetical protein